MPGAPPDDRPAEDRAPDETPDRALAAALDRPALDRRPDGGLLGAHRLIHHGGELWLVPRQLLGRGAMGPAPMVWLARALDWPGAPPATPALYWLAHAARQRAWRAAAAVPGPGPVVSVAAPGGRAVLLRLAMPGLPGRPAPPGLGARLAAAFTPAALARDAAWAARRGVPARERVPARD